MNVELENEKKKKLPSFPFYLVICKVWTTLIFGWWRHGIYLEM